MENTAIQPLQRTETLLVIQGAQHPSRTSASQERTLESLRDAAFLSPSLAPSQGTFPRTGAHLQFRSCSFAVADSHGQFALTALPLDGPASGRLGLWKVLLLDGAASGSVGAWQVASHSTV